MRRRGPGDGRERIPAWILTGAPVGPVGPASEVELDTYHLERQEWWSRALAWGQEHGYTVLDLVRARYDARQAGRQPATGAVR